MSDALTVLNPTPAVVDAELVKQNKKREKTGGEHLFDLTAYGGLALAGNEAAATAIVKAGEDAIRHPAANNGAIKTGLAKAMLGYDRFFDKYVGNTLSYLNTAAHKDHTVSRFSYISFAIIGGFSMVPLIKMLEDHKGGLVRYADGILHGKKAETDPEMIKAHQEMDEAPRQSWGSLMKGRMLTVATAFGIDSLIGWKNAPTTKIFRSPTLDKYNSFDKAAETLVNKTTGKLHGMGIIKSPEAPAWLHVAASLLTLSTALTILFYGSSKLFASRSAEREERREEKLEEAAAATATSPTPSLIAQPDRDEPSRTVQAGTLESRIRAPERQEGLQA